MPTPALVFEKFQSEKIKMITPGNILTSSRKCQHSLSLVFDLSKKKKNAVQADFKRAKIKQNRVSLITTYRTLCSNHILFGICLFSYAYSFVSVTRLHTSFLLFSIYHIIFLCFPQTSPLRSKSLNLTFISSPNCNSGPQ